jgi:hypothetical protein
MSPERPPRASARSPVNSMVARRLAPTLAFAVAVAGLACARSSATPGATLSALGAALERKDYDAAYALTSADFRARVPREAFRAELDEAGPDTQALGRRLRATVSGRLAATVELAPGEPVILVEDGGRWLIDDPSVFEPWSQRTPRAALRSFVHALERRRYDVVLRLCPTSRRASLSIDVLRAYWEGEHQADNAQLLARLRAALGAPIVETGDEARLPYGQGSEVRLVREDGLWKIEDPD